MGVSIKNVGKLAGVSTATVSRVINEKGGEIPISDQTKQKVMWAIKELNYQPNIMAKRLVTKKSYVAGVVINRYEMISGEVNAVILQGIGDVLDSYGYSMELITAINKSNIDDFLLKLLRGKQIDGLLILSDRVGKEFVDTAVSEKYPFCYVQKYPPVKKCFAVLCDNIMGGYMATKHLISLGHKNIMTIVGKNSSEGLYRLEGYKKALEESGIELNKDLIVDAKFMGRVNTNDINKPQFYTALKKCTAIFATSDLLAVGTMQLLNKENLQIPKDRALMGFDGLDMTTYLNPKLTTIRQDGYAIGKKAANTFLKLLDDKNEYNKNDLWTFIETKLLIRESSGEPYEESSGESSKKYDDKSTRKASHRPHAGRQGLVKAQL